MTRRPSPAWAVAALLGLLASAGAPAHGADSLALGAVRGPRGWTVAVPVTLADQAGTPLGADATPIRSLALQVRWEPAGAATGARIEPSGALAGAGAVMALSRGNAGGAALVLSFPADAGGFPAAGASAEVATVSLDLAAEAAGTVRLFLDPVGTLLGDAGGTLSETAAAGTLALLEGSVKVLPSVWLTVPGKTASEPKIVNGKFRVQRTGPTDRPLRVSYRVGGTAVNGFDYLRLPGVATIPAGASSVDVLVVPKPDAVKERTKLIQLTVLPRTSYAVEAPNTGVVRLVDTLGQ